MAGFGGKRVSGAADENKVRRLNHPGMFALLAGGVNALQAGRHRVRPPLSISRALVRRERGRLVAGSPAAALKALEALNDKDALRHYAPYHIARAEILRLPGRDAEAAGFYELAMGSGASGPVIEHLKERLATSL
jgi:predicted RNA polymerase sigma factor